MIFDLVVVAMLVGAFITGYKNGLVTTILRTVFFFAGAIGAMYLVVKFDQAGWLIVAIITGAYASALVGTLIAKTLKKTIIRGPFKWADSLLGAIFETLKYVVFFYIIGTILLYTPWGSGDKSVEKSQFYNKVQSYAPDVVTTLRANIEKLISNPQL